MKIYCVGHCSGRWDDFEEKFLGGFSSEENRKIAIDKYREMKYIDWKDREVLSYPEGKDGIGYFNCWEFEVDKID